MNAAEPEPSLDALPVAMLAVRIRSAFDALPELALTASQARRLWRHTHCEPVLMALVDVGFLQKTRSGAYVRSS